MIDPFYAFMDRCILPELSGWESSHSKNKFKPKFKPQELKYNKFWLK